MDKQFTKDAIGWGFLLWLIGYGLGIILFAIIPAGLLGWVIMPIGISITIWVLRKKIKEHSFSYFQKLAVIWTVMAIVLDYLFLVMLFKPADGYYKLDVYLYYALIFLLPLIFGRQQRSDRTVSSR